MKTLKYTLDDIRGPVNKLARHYTRFKVSERHLLTGHSHQAWPDVAYEGISESYFDACNYVDEKWERAFGKAERVRSGFAKLLDDYDGFYALAPNTHDLIIRFLSALDLRKKPKIVTTDSEFHTIRRQLDRLGYEGIEITKARAFPVTDAVGELIKLLDDKTAAVLVSAVFFETSQILPNIDILAERCSNKGIELLVDVYHATNVIPYSIKKNGLQRAFVVGGGYKYCQLGEANCFMRFPKDCELEPVITGWFSEFSLLGKKRNLEVGYGDGPARFAGSTYDPVSHYRAASVFDFFESEGLGIDFLREVSQHQIGLLAKEFDKLDLDPTFIVRDRDYGLNEIAGFLTLKSDNAGKICSELKVKGVLTDFRGKFLRFGPAPYLSDNQLSFAMHSLGEVYKDLNGI